MPFQHRERHGKTHRLGDEETDGQATDRVVIEPGKVMMAGGPTLIDDQRRDSMGVDDVAKGGKSIGVKRLCDDGRHR